MQPLSLSLPKPARLPASDRLEVLRFAATFLWADLDVAPQEHTFFWDLARELEIPKAQLPAVLDLLDAPPDPASVDPTRVRPEIAEYVRNAALRAIASDGRVEPGEMELFDLLDELLPASPSQPA